MANKLNFSTKPRAKCLVCGRVVTTRLHWDPRAGVYISKAYRHKTWQLESGQVLRQWKTCAGSNLTVKELL